MTLLWNKIPSLLKLTAQRNICSTSSLNAHWNKDYVAKPYPKSEEERKAAAEKYNLHPDEYKPYPDDGMGYGDYPELPFKGVALRDPHYPYDHPENKRNFNEAVHIDIDILGEDRIDAGVSNRYSNTVMVSSFILIFGGLFGACYLSNYIPMFQPVSEKQYPWTGKKYYTFEKAN